MAESGEQVKSQGVGADRVRRFGRALPGKGGRKN